MYKVVKEQGFTFRARGRKSLNNYREYSESEILNEAFTSDTDFDFEIGTFQTEKEAKEAFEKAKTKCDTTSFFDKGMRYIKADILHWYGFSLDEFDYEEITDEGDYFAKPFILDEDDEDEE